MMPSMVVLEMQLWPDVSHEVDHELFAASLHDHAAEPRRVLTDDEPSADARRKR